MTELIPKEEFIADKIYKIRGQKVLLDADLAALYGVETKVLKRQVRRNIERFPDDFLFELTKEEFQFFKEPIWHLKMGRTFKISTYGLYRTRCSHAFRCS